MGLWLPKRRVRLYKGRGSSVALKVMFATVGLFNYKKNKKNRLYEARRRNCESNFLHLCGRGGFAGKVFSPAG